MSVYFFRGLAASLLMLVPAAKSSAQVFKFLVPDAAVAQFAGSVGYFSGGISYDVFKNNRGNLDFMYGFVPENKGGALNIVTVKFAYRPWEFKVKDRIKIYPLNPGFFATYTFHEDLSFEFDSEQYPKNYYYWSEALRPHLSFSSEIEINPRILIKGAGLKAISLYSELNTNDYYIINYFQNMSALSLSDVFQLGIGLKVKF